MRVSFYSFSRVLTAGILAVSFIAGNVIAVPNTDAQMVSIDGSSTVYPITEAVAEEFGIKNRSVKITVGISGTGGGFKKFCAGETDLSNASRPIKSSEKEKCVVNGVEHFELPVAYDALSVVVNPRNTWANSMTVAELKMLWEPAAQGKITRWNQIRAEWPDEKIHLFGPGVDSGTFDYFTEAIVGKSQMSRGDFTSSEDVNVLVQGVANNRYALGFFGMAYYEENQDKLKAVAIDDGDDTNGVGPQAPTMANVVKDVYRPLARPLFIYVSQNAMRSKPIVNQFVKFYLENSDQLATEVGYVQLPGKIKAMANQRYTEAVSNRS